MAKTASKSEFVVFVGSADPELELERLKIYRRAPAEPGDPKGYIRVIDESGDDYLYPQDLFERIEVPRRVAEALNAAA